MMALSVAEEMAIEVLKGNMATAKALADKLCEEVNQGIHLPPVSRIDTVDVRNLRCVVYYSLEVAREALIDTVATKQAIENWLTNPGTHLILVGVERIELYVLP